MNVKKNRLWLLLLIAAANLAADQGSKAWARRVLKPLAPSEMTVIPNWWDFRYSENMGSVFGLFRQHSVAPMALTILGIIILGLVLAFVVVQFVKEEASLATTFGYGCVVGGAVGNIIDRLVYGRVTDFIVWYFVTKSPQGVTERHEWYTFNVADASLVVGLILLAPMMLKSAPKPASKQSAA